TRSALTFRFATSLRLPIPATPHARTLCTMPRGQSRGHRAHWHIFLPHIPSLHQSKQKSQLTHRE
ncbi:hypothetical protein, partial [Chryseosolibacter indicus]